MIRCRSCNFKTEEEKLYKLSGAYASSGIYRRIRNYELLWEKANKSNWDKRRIPISSLSLLQAVITARWEKTYETPGCTKNLNQFELLMIRYVTPYLTVAMLGQVLGS